MLGKASKKPGRTSLRVGLLAGAAVAAMAVAGIGASGASAAPLCTGTNLAGAGSSLQKIAQLNVWAPGFASTACPGGPTISYNSIGSGAGLHEWNADGVTGTINHSLQFIGTDDAPTTAQINNILSASGAGTSVLVVPVAQTAISIVANPPAGCTVEAITNRQLEQVFRGTLKSWSNLETAEGSCASPITRVVRKDGSGTSYQFKNYLARINTANLPCIGKTWAQIEPIENGETGAPNTSWPESCSGTSLSSLVRPTGTGGGELVKKVNATAGSIGYAALPDAKANSAADILSVQNNGQVTAATATFANPAEGGVANCSATTYKVPLEGRKRTGSTGENADWSQVFGANPSIGGTSYPLCTLTYDLAFKGYVAAGFTFKNATTAKDYLREYVVAPAGQSAIVSSGTFYAALPSTTKTETNVLGAAEFAGGKIHS